MKISDLHEKTEHKVSLTKAELLDEVLLFFREKPKAGRAEFLSLSKKLGISEDQLIELEFDLCKSLCSKIGKHVSHGKEPVDKDQLRQGIKHEMEHTNDEYIARMIALDHLYELPDYYDRLSKIEHH